jgi:NADPH:quinone reductase-like Zn-dependent oxidoreductase
MNNKKIVAPRFGGPEVLQVVEDAIPEPGEGELLVKMLTAGVSFADVMWMSGTVPGGPKTPFTPGYDVVGTIQKLGPGVSGLAVGERVAAQIHYGGYAEYVIVPSKQAVKVPVELDSTRAVCAILNYLTAYQIYHRITGVSAKPGTRVLIHGAAGGVGTALLDLGRVFGFEMYGTVSKNKQGVVTKLGGKPIDYGAEDFVEGILKRTGTGVDVVIDPIGGPHFWQSFRSLRKGGMLVATASMASVRGLSMLRTILAYMQVSLWNVLPNGRSATFLDLEVSNEKNPAWYQEDLPQVIRYLSEGKINPIVARVLPLTQAAEAHRLLLDRRVEGKIVLVPG